jgi:guanylate kinase
MSGSLLVVSGPSGSGKSSLCKKVCEDYDFAFLSVSTTTRAARNGEEEGRDYFFASRDAFKKAIDEGEFLEWAQVHDNYYGTSKKSVKNALREEKTVVFDIDVQGRSSIAALFPNETTSVFVTTPTIAILKERLLGRGAEDAAAIEKRLQNAVAEMERIDQYDYLLINDRFDRSLETLKGVALASRIKRGKVQLRKFIADWQTEKGF